MRVSVEEINGRKCTVIRYRKSKSTPEAWFFMPDGVALLLFIERDGGANCYAVALPALPRHPKPEDAQKLYAYMKEGLRPFAVAMTKKGQPMGSWCGDGVIQAATASRFMKITHAIDPEGNRVEIAIEDGEL